MNFNLRDPWKSTGNREQRKTILQGHRLFQKDYKPDVISQFSPFFVGIHDIRSALHHHKKPNECVRISSLSAPSCLTCQKRGKKHKLNYNAKRQIILSDV